MTESGGFGKNDEITSKDVCVFTRILRKTKEIDDFCMKRNIEVRKLEITSSGEVVSASMKVEIL